MFAPKIILANKRAGSSGLGSQAIASNVTVSGVTLPGSQNIGDSGTSRLLGQNNTKESVKNKVSFSDEDQIVKARGSVMAEPKSNIGPKADCVPSSFVEGEASGSGSRHRASQEATDEWSDNDLGTQAE